MRIRRRGGGRVGECREAAIPICIGKTERLYLYV